MRHILKCPNCSKFTMKDACACGTKAIQVRPQKYSPEKYAEYRRKAKLEELKKKNLL